MKYNLEVNNLTKEYPDFKLNKLNFKLPAGKIIGLIGKNGSGKTTTIKAILNLINYDGQIKIFNEDNHELTKIEREQIGIVLDDSFFSPILNVHDINNLMRHFYHNWNEKQFYKYVKEFKIPTNRSLKEFSNGMKMKVKVICAISHEPKLLILDEPTNGLDPIFRYEILDMFSKFVSNNTNSILITTHITSDLEHIADEIIFMDEGKIILDTKKEVIDNSYGLVELPKTDLSTINKNAYSKILQYKDTCLLLIMDKTKFMEEYPHLNIRKPSLEELMLLIVKGV